MMYDFKHLLVKHFKRPIEKVHLVTRDELMNFLLPPFTTRNLACRNVRWCLVWKFRSGSRTLTRSVGYGTVAAKNDLEARETPVITPSNMSREYDETGCVPAFSDLSFRSIGLEHNLVNALQKAFPDVKRPTVVQEKLIQEILGGRDILLKDDTGSGKYVLFHLFLATE